MNNIVKSAPILIFIICSCRCGFLSGRGGTKLELREHEVIINTVYRGSKTVFNGLSFIPNPLPLKLKHGANEISIADRLGRIRTITAEIKRDGEYLFRPQDNDLNIKNVGVFPCGPQPKQVIFTPEGRYILIPDLDGKGFDVFDTDEHRVVRTVEAPDPDGAKGFAEGLFIAKKGLFLVSQMTKGLIYEYSYPGFELKRTIKTGGAWSKYMAYSDELGVIAVSNWSTNDVSVIDHGTGKLKARIRTGNAPRGLAFGPEGKHLYVTVFDGGSVHKYRTSDWTETAVIKKPNAAMRHIVLSNDGKEAYVSDMFHNNIFVINTDDFVITDTYKVDDNPNTIEITQNGRYLFVSCRGPNDPQSYLNRSPKNGGIAVIDLASKKKTAFIEGGNQPTGLDIGPGDKYLCFSNFRDNNIELYNIEDLINEK